ncbi:MAG: DHH family phosphoesterase [Dermatophilaceae bacterium]
MEGLDQALKSGERILLYGDYDVDGTTSVALMYAFLSGFYQNLDYYLPDRDKEGYGVSLAGVEYARETGCTLVIAMDCGIKAHDAVSSGQIIRHRFYHLRPPPAGRRPARRRGQPRSQTPRLPLPLSKNSADAALPSNSPRHWLYTTTRPPKNSSDLLDLVAVSIACDIVPDDRRKPHAGAFRPATAQSRHPA